MPNRAQIIRILQIAEEVEPGEWIQAEHDELYVAGENAQFSDAQKKELEALGCVKDNTGWMCFT